MIRLLVADDHMLIRNGIRHTVQVTNDIIVADEARNGQEVLDKVQHNDYDVILLDISMPGRDGLEILKELRLQKGGAPVLILSIYPEELYAVRALRSGAAGYLTKDSAPDELISAIRKVHNGGRYVTASLAEKLATSLSTPDAGQRHELLSDREYQLLCMMASGKTQTEIAGELCLSIKTIGTYRTRILAKMNMKSNAEIMRYAIENKLV
jgi:two-component system invasion response regulator UvrY